MVDHNATAIILEVRSSRSRGTDVEMLFLSILTKSPCSRGGGPGKTRRRTQTRILHSRMHLATPPLQRNLPVKKINRM